MATTSHQNQLPVYSVLGYQSGLHSLLLLRKARFPDPPSNSQCGDSNNADNKHIPVEAEAFLITDLQCWGKNPLAGPAG
jgi:hypothetical protein